jgi:YVTN family beta-propeller protein
LILDRLALGRGPGTTLRSLSRRLLPFVLTLVAVLAGLPALAQQRGVRFRRGGPALEVAARARTNVQPKSVSVSPDGTRVVVCNFGRPDQDNVYVYDARTLERVGAVSFQGNAVESAWSPDGRTLYVSNFRRNMLEVIDFESLAVRAEVPVGAGPKTIVVSPDGATVYVANYFGRSVSVVDARELRELRRLRTGDRPRGMAVMDDGTLLAAAFHGERIHVFAPGASEEADSWDVCPFPRDILPVPNGGFYLTCSLGHIGLYRFENEGRPYAIVPTGRNPRSIGTSRDGRWIGVANFTSSDVTLIDTVDHTVRRFSVPGAHGIVGLAMHPGPDVRMYATSWDTSELILLTPGGE